MPEVDRFKFGAIFIDGKKYKRDVILFPDGTVRERKRGFWRLGSHSIKKEEVDELIGANPDTVIIAKGAMSRAKLASDTESALQEARVELIVLPSKEAVERFNEHVREGKRVAALIHITC
ncbi:MTH938/NDUFAF3 family protein [Chloroflexota bacterium]